MAELQSLIEAHFIQRKKEEEELIALVNRIVSTLQVLDHLVLLYQDISRNKLFTLTGTVCRISAVLREQNNTGSGQRKKRKGRPVWQ